MCFIRNGGEKIPWKKNQNIQLRLPVAQQAKILKTIIYYCL